MGLPGVTGEQGPAGLQGATGSTGPAGSDGYNTLLATTALTSGDANCAAGGFQIDVGLDTDRNGTLEVGERDAALTRFVCNGEPNATLDSLAITTPLDTIWPGSSVLQVKNAGGLELLGLTSAGDFQLRGPDAGDTLFFQGKTGAFRLGRFAMDPSGALLPAHSIALGFQAQAIAERAFAVNGYASGIGAIALGSGAAASGDDASALGPSSIAGGLGSVALGPCVANGSFAACLGLQNRASGNFSLALGKNADTNGHQGSIVLSDGSAAFASDAIKATANNQFTVRAIGGHRLFTNVAGTVGCSIAPGGGTWACTSDRNAKEAFRDVDAEEVLAKLARIPIQSWRFRSEEGATRHLGPTAQDFHAAFGLGANDTTIGGVDADGVNMLAIQALERRTAEVAELRAEVSELRTRLDALAAQIGASGR